MLKGVNKQIIEVTNPPSPYFDKIIFIVSANGSQKSQSDLEKEAENLSNEIKKPPKQKITKKKILSVALNLSLGFGAGGMIMLLLNYFIK